MVLAGGESADEVKRPLGLVEGHHVAGVAHQHLRELPDLLDVAGQLATDPPGRGETCSYVETQVISGHRKSTLRFISDYI